MGWLSFLLAWPLLTTDQKRREEFKYQRSDNKIKAWIKMHMFYWKLQPQVDQRLASKWNQNWWAWTSLQWFLTPVWSRLLFIFHSGLFCHHQQGLLGCQKEVKPTALQSLPNLRCMALEFTMCDMFQSRNSKKLKKNPPLKTELGKIEKWCEGLLCNEVSAVSF